MAKNMNIIFRKPPEQISQASEVQNKKRMDETSFGNSFLPLMWGKVKEKTGMQTVNIELINGLKIKDVPVASKEWVAPGTVQDSTLSSGQIDLPPVNAKVLIAFIDGVIDNPVVLPISGFDILISNQLKVLLKSDQQSKVINVDEYGWKMTYDKETGKLIYQSPDVDDYNQITLTVDVENKSIVLDHRYSTDSTDRNTITIDTNGISLVDTFGNEFEFASTGVKITDLNGNTIEGGTTSLKLNGNLEVLQ
ncbi:MAG: hypothetical protein C4K49_10545 [Candidatus Thorarchaeota archaeon]|nr:MAG: hypothetical protein C4K49_10545 [Candidatus Thorarchaeota archaeon]